jgi:ABC-type transporter MlaC component
LIFNDSVTQITKELAKEWKTLSDTDKEPYEKKATEAKTKYQTEMAEYKKKHGIEDKKKKPAASKKRKAKDEEEEEEEEDADE